jgi:hypothetical protein
MAIPMKGNSSGNTFVEMQADVESTPFQRGLSFGCSFSGKIRASVIKKRAWKLWNDFELENIWVHESNLALGRIAEMRTVSALIVYTRKTAFGLLFLIYVFLAQPIFAQEPNQCRDVLQKTDVHRLDTLNMKLTFLRLIETEEDWQKTQKAGLDLQAVYDSIPVGAKSNYDDFQKWRQKTLNETHFDLSDQEAHSLETTFLPAEAIEAWKECMKVNTGGLALAVEDIQPTAAMVHLYWIEPSAVVGTSLIPVAIKDNSPQGALKSWPAGTNRITANGDWRLTYNRDPNRALIIDIDASDGRGHHTTATARVPAEPQYRNTPCMFDLADFRGVPHGSKWSFPSCTALKPGGHALVRLSGASFRVDGPHGVWIELGSLINSDSGYKNDAQLDFTPVHPGDPVEGNNDPHPWNWAETVPVPWDGIVNVKIWVIRAQQFPGGTSSLSAVGGQLTVTPQ